MRADRRYRRHRNDGVYDNLHRHNGAIQTVRAVQHLPNGPAYRHDNIDCRIHVYSVQDKGRAGACAYGLDRGAVRVDRRFGELLRRVGADEDTRRDTH